MSRGAIFVFTGHNCLTFKKKLYINYIQLYSIPNFANMSRFLTLSESMMNRELMKDQSQTSHLFKTANGLQNIAIVQFTVWMEHLYIIILRTYKTAYGNLTTNPNLFTNIIPKQLRIWKFKYMIIL